MSDFISDDTVDEIAEDMQGSFHTVLHSQSTIPQIAFWVRREMEDRGLPTRKSLCFLIARRALLKWHLTIQETHMALDS